MRVIRAGLVTLSLTIVTLHVPALRAQRALSFSDTNRLATSATVVRHGHPVRGAVVGLVVGTVAGFFIGRSVASHHSSDSGEWIGPVAGAATGAVLGGVIGALFRTGDGRTSLGVSVPVRLTLGRGRAP